MRKNALFFLINTPIWIATLSFVFFKLLYEYIKQPGYWEHGPTSHKIFYSCALTIWFLTSFYVFYSYLVPSYLTRNKKPFFWSLSAIYVLLVGPVLIFILQELSTSLFNMGVGNIFKTELKYNVLSWLHWIGNAFICGFLGSIFRLAFDS